LRFVIARRQADFDLLDFTENAAADQLHSPSELLA
jgi:hypothetical protein